MDENPEAKVKQAMTVPFTAVCKNTDSNLCNMSLPDRQLPPQTDGSSNPRSLTVDLSEMLEPNTRDLMANPKPLVKAQKKALPVGCGGRLQSL